MSGGLGSAVVEFASAAGLLVLPILIYRGVTKLLHAVVDEEVYQVPVIFILSRLAGFVWALLWLAGGLGERAFRLSELFTPESVWNIPAHVFLEREGNLFAYDFGAIGRWIASGESRMAGAAAVAALLALAAAQFLSLKMFKRPRRRLSAQSVIIVTTVVTAWQAVYLITLPLWLIQRANFWSLALMAFYLQYRRNRAADH